MTVVQPSGAEQSFKILGVLKNGAKRQTDESTFTSAMKEPDNPLKVSEEFRVQLLTREWVPINSVVQRESFILAFNDCFEIIAIGLLVGAVLVWFCKRAPIGGQGDGH